MNKDSFDITKVVNSKKLLTRNQADVVLDYIKLNPNKYIDFKNVESCTSPFINHLIFNYNSSIDFDRHRKLVFFNVKEPIVSLKIQESQFNFFTKEVATYWVEFHNKLINDILENE